MTVNCEYSRSRARVSASERRVVGVTERAGGSCRSSTAEKRYLLGRGVCCGGGAGLGSVEAISIEVKKERTDGRTMILKFQVEDHGIGWDRNCILRRKMGDLNTACLKLFGAILTKYGVLVTTAKWLG